jgi:hypothetical protein
MNHERRKTWERNGSSISCFYSPWPLSSQHAEGVEGEAVEPHPRQLDYGIVLNGTMPLGDPKAKVRESGNNKIKRRIAMESLTRKRFSAGQVIGFLLAVFLWAAGPVSAQVTIPNTFSPGTTISSSEVNANFSTLSNAMPAVKQIKGEIWVTMPTSGTDLTVQSIAVTPPRRWICNCDGSRRCLGK